MKEFYTCRQIADRYGVKIATVWDWIREGKLAAIRIGKLYRISKESIDDFEKNK